MNRECRNDSKSSPTSLTTFPVISKNELTCSSLKHLASNNNLYNNDASNSNSVNERKFKTKVESFPKMHSIQENVDYEMNMKLPKYITNYKNKQTKYLLNLTQSKYKKRRSFSFLDYSVYKTNSYYYYNNRESDANENYASFYRSHNYYHNNSSIKSSIHYKRSEYGRFKRSKDSGPSLADVPMNVDFNTSNPSYTSNRYHVFSFEQVKRLDAVMNSYVNIAPKPRLQNLIDTDTSEVIQESSSCFCTQEPYVCYIEGRISAGITEKTPSQFSKLPSTRTENATDNNSASDVITPEPFRTATTVPSVNSKAKTTCSDILCYEKCKAHTAKPVSSPDLHSQNKCAFHSHIHPPTNASVNPFLIPPKLPTIRVQLKKLIKTVRDRLVEESVPVKEIRINGGAAGCIVGSQNKPTFSDIDLIFRVDLSNSATCTKIKSVVFASMEHILVGMEKLSHSSRSCTYCCNCTLPFTMSPTQIPRDPASSYCLPCTCCLCHPFNKCFHLNKENFEDAKSNTHSTYDISKHKHNFSYSTSSESSNYRQPLHENDLNTVQLSNISNENSSQPRTHQKSEFHQKNENQTEKCNLHYCTSYHPLSALHPYYLYDSCLQPVACSMCSKQLNCLYHSKNNKHISNSNDHNNNTPCTGNSHIDIIVKQYIQKTYRVFKLNSKTSDSWLSFSVGYRVSKDNDEKIINIKFIDRMHRQFEFTVDSFQIVLDSLLTFYDSSKGHSQQMNENFYPTLVAESVSGSYVEALAHLNDCVIATHRPEEIHGGGLLKYCKLLVEGYKQSETIDVISMEKYMCSRFFIDFPDILSQYHQMNCFLMNYFENDSKMKANYLNILYEVVSHSTICLMTHERQQTLCLIQMFLRDVTERQQNQHQRLRESQQSIVHLQEFSSKNWALDKVFYGTNYFPKQMYSVSEENAVYDSITKRNPTRLETSKQLSAKNNSAISKSTPSKVKSNQAKLEKYKKTLLMETVINQLVKINQITVIYPNNWKLKKTVRKL
ncbi:unnamed protein product [Heterobilharzia americana]|nr:unnamed protein product [Heterobilharzia americana]